MSATNIKGNTLNFLNNYLMYRERGTTAWSNVAVFVSLGVKVFSAESLDLSQFMMTQT